MARRTVLLPGLRHRALLSVMLYSFARVSAVLGMIRLFWEAGRWQIDAEQATAVVPRAPGGDGTGDSGTVSPSTGARAGRRAA